MNKEEKKEKYAKSISATFQYCYKDIFDKIGEIEVFNPLVIEDYLEKPKDPKMGRYSLPVFRFTQLLQSTPPDIANKIAEKSGSFLSGEFKHSIPGTIIATGSFLNIVEDPSSLAKDTITEILNNNKKYGQGFKKNKKPVLVEYSSVNIAKPFGIAHLRTTILGASLAEIYKKLGYNVIRLNYLGDWGTQFGKLIVAYRKWGQVISLDDPAIIDKLFELYVRFHIEAKKDDSLEDEAREVFKALENGDKSTFEIWDKFRDISLKDYERIYKAIGVEFELITGEAFLNDKIEPVIERFEKAGLSSISEGALIVDLHDPQLPPCLLRKADGATLYATRDITGAFWRKDEYDYQKSLYVVANSQSDHFKQVFKAITMLEDAEGLSTEKRISDKVCHVDFGWVKFGDEVMSTRAGNVINLEDVVKKAVDLVKDKIKEKNPNLETIDTTAAMVGLGAVKFSQLSVKRQKDVNFIWEAVLSFEGETGPYLQYTHARLCSLMRKYNQPINSSIDVNCLNFEEEQRVIELLADFPESIIDAGRNNDPYFVAIHLLKLASAFNKFYQRKTEDNQSDKIISDNEELTKARMALVKSVQIVIKEGLRLLSIKAPEEM